LARLAAAITIAACASPAATPSPAPAPVTLADAVLPENLDIYRNSGFVVGSGAIPFVGLVRFAATEYLDSTAVIIALSIPPRSLSFVRAGDRYAAFYGMRVDLLRGDAIARSERPTGEVRVASFAETTRGDEGVIFQRSMRVAPGDYTMRVTVQDSLGTGSGVATATVRVPAMDEGVVAPMIPVFVSEPRTTRSAPLTVVANPRATARYGRDSVLEIYAESYGAAAPDTIIFAARGVNAVPLAVDTVVAARGDAVRAMRIAFPVFRLGLGPARVSASLPDGRELDATTVVVNLGMELPVASVAELIEALRYFAGEPDLQRLRSATDAARPSQWASLVRRTDPNPATPDNEALLEYARRLRLAERLYRDEDRRGWQTDRGAVVVALGEPDFITEPQPADSLGSSRVVTWEYRRHQRFLVFSESAGSGAWRLTPVSAAEFRALLALAGPCVGCR
jgi:GWxTD domain-containing protein